jgi:hypothetical protein
MRVDPCVPPVRRVTHLEYDRHTSTPTTDRPTDRERWEHESANAVGRCGDDVVDRSIDGDRDVSGRREL